MKWVTFISFIVLVSSTASKHLPRRSRDAGPSDTIGHSYSEIPDEDFQGIALIAFVNYVPNITYEDAEKMVNDITELGKKCSADGHAVPECEKSLNILIPEELCHEQSVAEHYGYSECCSKVDHEIHECLLSHRNATPDSFPPYERPEPEAACKAFQENRHKVLGGFLFEVARRNRGASILVLFHTAAKYDEVLQACCQAEDKPACFKEKAPPVKKQMKQFVMMEKQNCFLLKKFGPKPVHNLKLALVAQKFPKAEHSVLHNITQEIVHIHAERCKGDIVESHLDKIALAKFACGHQDILSPKMKGCCEKMVLHQPFCLVMMENDDLPADLSPTVREFVDNKEEVCQHYVENPGGHVERFLYEYARRHPELSAQSLLRIQKGYHDLLEKCCQPETPENCLLEGEPLLRKHVADTMDVIRTNCELYAKMGDYAFQTMLLVHYTKKAPQLSSEELVHYTSQLLAVAAKCCSLGEDKKMTCAESHTVTVLVNICMRHGEHPINSKICQCCSSSYAFLRECFSAIGVDDGYSPAPYSPELFSFHEDLCTDNSDTETTKRKLLVNLVKCKPNITAEQLNTTLADFNGVKDKCCQAENHEQCFHEEGPKLVERSQAALS
ncbi:albumin-like [Heteronotia binoei]|uniref:albumin-like n=1 Tax=Heteronotia binoei TaxID=13085 RepID=UPI00292FF4AF|nr:albumin-like [Heteronotia binoei]